MRSAKKRGQVTIFIIIAIIVVGLGVLIYSFFPQIKTTLGLGPKTPSEFIQTCIEDRIRETAETLSLKGGSINPEYYYLYNGGEVEYLCYTNEYYIPCIVQQPLLKPHIENEIKKEIKTESQACFNSLEESYRRQGYSVNLVRGDSDVELLPKRIIVTFNNQLTLTKGESERYEEFVVVLNNNLYELIGIANSIIDWESRYGDAETTVYMDYYRDLKVEKKKQSDGTTIYILTDRNTENKFQFASRSVVWPPGYD